MPSGGSSDMSVFRSLLRYRKEEEYIRFSDESVTLDTSKGETEKNTYVISNTDWKLDVKL